MKIHFNEGGKLLVIIINSGSFSYYLAIRLFGRWYRAFKLRVDPTNVDKNNCTCDCHMMRIGGDFPENMPEHCQSCVDKDSV